MHILRKRRKKLNLKKKYAKLKKEIFFNQIDLLTISVSLDSATVSSRFCGARIRESWNGTSSGHVCRVSNFRHSIVATGKLRRSYYVQPITSNNA